ncbi:hypothetical protein CgunFtcFv8_009962 [Champsocephalus gunnari]|uniref:Uncharacterized protein n=1 Tax=Champsocephalus gunnari TaxID=52237 RepID=A0AAN8C3Z8_CHAGU|nr:hypothetical protein CgunFtcFv8_009962 [Champsocephalus gunnari]
MLTSGLETHMKNISCPYACVFPLQAPSLIAASTLHGFGLSRRRLGWKYDDKKNGYRRRRGGGTADPGLKEGLHAGDITQQASRTADRGR